MSNDTICALATAPGGALGIIRVSGAKSLDILFPFCYNRFIKRKENRN